MPYCCLQLPSKSCRANSQTLFTKMHTGRTRANRHKQEHVKFQYRQEIFHHEGGQALEQAAQCGKCWTQPQATCSNWAWLSRRLDYVIPFNLCDSVKNLYNVKEDEIGEQQACCYHWFNAEDFPKEWCEWTAE